MLYFWTAVLLIMLFLYMMPIVISIDIKKDNNADKITIGIKTFYGMLKLKSEIPFLVITFENGKPALKYKIEVADKYRSKLLARFGKILNLKEGEGLLKTFNKIKGRIKPVLKYISRKTNINKFILKMSVGTGDAAATGILYGAAWMALGNILAFVSGFLNINNPRIVIVPIFSKIQLCVDFSCIISLKLGHIINAGIRALPALLSDSE